MKSVFLRGLICISLTLPMTLGIMPVLAQSQGKTQPSKAINLDKELQGDAPQNIAQSYYHFALAKWNDAQGDLEKAITEMRQALRYNEKSATVRVELAALLQSAGDTQGALEEAEEAERLDPADAEARWLLANIYSRTAGRGVAAREGMRKAVKELETLRDIAPSDERAYYALGGAYFDLDEPEKAIQAFEKFQQLNNSSNAGYREIAKYYEKIDKQDKCVEYLQKAIDAQPDDWESLLKLATLYSKSNKNEEAVPIYRKILELVGEDNATVRRQLALSMVEAGQNGEAIKLLEEMVASTPNDAVLQILYARALIGNNQLPKAIETLQSILKDDPNNMEANYHLGSAYERSNRLSEAAAIFTQLLEKSDSDSEEYKANRTVFQQHLAADYQEMGEMAKAIAIYEGMVKSDPNPRLFYLLLNAYRVNRQFDKAITLGKEQYEKSPDNVDIGLVYARTLADAGKVKEGIDILNGMLQKDPDNVDVGLVYARMLADTGKVKEGIDYLNGMLQKDPGNVDVYVNLSQIYLQNKRYADAEKTLRRAEDKKLDNERLKFQLVTIYERQKDFDRAESLLEQILKENPRNASALNYIGYMLADRGVRLQEAVKYVEEALEIDPNNGAYLDSLGWAFFKLNDLQKAEKYLKQAVDLIKNDPVIHDHLGDLYYKAGDLNKARDSWLKSLNQGGEPEDAQKVKEKLEKLQETLRKQKR
jgi:tetratricopeptide (TPR) repeat protein